MKLACVWIALMMSLPPMGLAQARHTHSRQGAETPAPGSRTPATVIGSREERTSQAASLYDKGRFVEAALEFEGLVRDFPQDPDFLFNAAVSRYGAGHHAHTVAYTREYLANKTLLPEDRKEAEAQLAEALPRVTPIRVTVRAPTGGPSGATVVAQHVARASSDLRPELLFPVTLSEQPASVELELDPGSWTLRVEGPGYQQQEQLVELAPGTPGAVEFALVQAPAPAEVTPAEVTTPEDPSPAREVPADVVQKMKLGLAISGGATMLAGIVVPAIGAVQIRKQGDYMCVKNVSGGADLHAPCRRAWIAPYRTRDAGLALLGGGVGLLAGGLTWMVEDPRRRQTAFVVEAVTGGLVAAGGVASLFFATKLFNNLNGAGGSAAERAAVSGRLAPHAVSMTALGLGLGLLTSAAIGLGVQRKHMGSLRAGALAGPGQAGVLLSGSF